MKPCSAAQALIPWRCVPSNVTSASNLTSSQGGYFYATPVGFPTLAFKLGQDGNGVPVFSQVGQSHGNSAGRVGVGIPTITSLNGKPGSGIVWMADPDVGLRAFAAVPGEDGYLVDIPLPQINGANKFQRPAFGDTRLYITDSNGVLYCLGSPVNLPLNCTTPVDFGNVALGSSAMSSVTCTANIAIAAVDGTTVGDASFQVSNASLPSGPVAAGSSFTFPVTWNLTKTVVENAPNASYGNTEPGIKSTALTLYTTNAVTGYATEFPIGLTGTEVSEDAFLILEPVNVDFGGVVLLNNTVPTESSEFVIGNAGLSPLTITGYAYTTGNLDDDDIDYTNATADDTGNYDLGYGFTSMSLPPVGTAIQAGQSVSVPLIFNPLNGTGSYQSYFNVWSSGGTSDSVLEGSASTAPIADFGISNGEGGWLPPSNLLMDFGDVAPGGNATRQIRICNDGGSVLIISKSKPPNGIITATAPGIDLHETQQIPVNQCAYGTVIFAPNVEPPDEAPQVVNNTWTLNTNDPNFGVHVVECTGTIEDRALGPLLANGTSRFLYLGCYLDSANGGPRLLPSLTQNGAANENGLCQNETLQGEYIFAGTEYQIQCWSGNIPPSLAFLVNDDLCTFACPADPTQACGGVGGYISIYYDATRYNPGNGSTAPGAPMPGAPETVPSVSNFTSLGCYTEANNSRALTGLAAPSSNLTVEVCAETCYTYAYFGVEYSQEVSLQMPR